MFSRLQTRHIFPVAALFSVIFFVIALITKGGGFTDHSFMLITVTSFLFGIFITFSILNNQDKLNRVNELLKLHDSNFLVIYKLSHEFDKDVVDKCRKLIDKHMIDEIDYRLPDFSKSAPSFYELYDYCLSLKPDNEQQRIVYDKIIDVLNDTAKARQQVEVLTRQKVSRYEWFSILTLLALMFYLLLAMNEGTVLSALLTSVLATSAIVLTLVLQTVNNLRWQEETQIWEPLHRLFLSLDLLPYFPKDVITVDRYIPSMPGQLRLSEYPNRYPDMSGKTVKIVDWHGRDPR